MTPLHPQRTTRGLLTVFTLALAPLWATAQPSLPTAPVRNVPETFFGTVVDDPYRDLEDPQAPAVAAWMKAHSDHAYATLQRIAGRAALRAAVERYDAAAAARVVNVQRLPSGALFYEHRAPKDDQFKLYMRATPGGPEKLLFDPEVLKKQTGKPHAINYFAPSPDGKLVALGVSEGGSEDASLRILDTTSGAQLGPEISRVRWGGLAWAPDGSELYLHRMQEMKPGMAPTETFQRSVTGVIRPGQGEDNFRPVLRAGVDLGIPATEFPFLEVLPDGTVIAYAHDGVSPDFRAWHSTLMALRAGKPQWTQLVDREDGVTALVVRAKRVWALSFRDASRFKLLSAPLEGFKADRAQVLVPEGQRVLAGIGAAADALYVEAREGNIKRLYKLGYNSPNGELQPVELPLAGAFSLGNGSTRPDVSGVLLELESWTRARQIYAVTADGKVSNTGLQPAGPFDAPDNVAATEVMVKSHDGAMVPMSIIHRKGTRLDGNNPTILYGYASYGITEEPFFSTNRQAWLDAGGVFAVANPRGSGVFGRAWHEAGRQTTKPNTWKDFIACAEYLVAQGWTQPARLGLLGGSAGGILVGRAMTERPELFAAVLPAVGSLDTLRAETTPNGVPNIPEFGTRTNEAGFRALLAMSTYHHIKEGVNYPAVMLTHGVNDPRVTVGNSTKTAARLLAASKSGKPVLLRLEYDAGHGIGNTKAQVFDEVADRFAFFLWQMGVPGYELMKKAD